MTDDREIQEEPEEVARSLPIDWRISENMPTLHITNMLIQFTGYEFVVSFFEAHPPTLMGSMEEQRAKLDALSAIPAVCVARVSIAVERMGGFVEALQEAYKNHGPQTEETSDEK